MHLAIDELSSQRLPPGASAPAGSTYLEILKTTNRQTNQISSLAFDAQGQAVAADKVFGALAQRRDQKFGRLSEVLYNKIATLKGTDQVGIDVWPIIDFDIHAYEKPIKGPYDG